jgi:hypothetical protein
LKKLFLSVGLLISLQTFSCYGNIETLREELRAHTSHDLQKEFGEHIDNALQNIFYAFDGLEELLISIEEELLGEEKNSCKYVELTLLKERVLYAYQEWEKALGNWRIGSKAFKELNSEQKTNHFQNFLRLSKAFHMALKIYQDFFLIWQEDEA